MDITRTQCIAHTNVIHDDAVGANPNDCLLVGPAQDGKDLKSNSSHVYGWNQRTKYVTTGMG